MKHSLPGAVFLAAVSLPALSLAQTFGQSHEAVTGSVGPQEPQRVAYAQPAQRSGLGGGFIEMLVTGRDPSPRYGRSYAPQAYEPAAPDLYAPRARGHILAPQASVAPSQIDPRFDARPVRKEIDARYQRQDVSYSGGHAPGTIVIDTPNKFLYLVREGGMAVRYGIGVGRPGFTWAGTKTVTRKAEWPSWTPPAEMLKRRPDLPRFMAGGPNNPLGARALYLGSTLYRIHGTNEPETIGEAVSSGCIRMTNDDVIDLYGRVRVGQRVVVM